MVAALLIASFGEARAAITMQAEVVSATVISITATGTITGPIPADQSTILFIDALVGSPKTSMAVSGTFQVGATSVTSSFVGYENEPYINPIQLRLGAAPSVDDVVTFNGTLTSSVAHNLTNEDIDGAAIYWGYGGLEFVDGAWVRNAGTYQGEVAIVPEPTTTMLMVFATAGALLIRRRVDAEKATQSPAQID